MKTQYKEFEYFGHVIEVPCQALFVATNNDGSVHAFDHAPTYDPRGFWVPQLGLGYWWITTIIIEGAIEAKDSRVACD